MVMDVREVRVTMHHGGVTVRVGVGLHRGLTVRMDVPVVRVVGVRVVVLELAMVVQVGVVLGEVQPHSNRHKSPGPGEL